MTSIALDEPPTVLRPDSPGWPRELNELARVPARLFVAGSLPPAPRVAIVGTRRADAAAEAFARRMAAELAAAGVCVVSGGAAGIDAAAHRGALGAGNTVAVLAGGVREAFPSGHAGLFAKIARSGALVSEHDDGCNQAYRFLERNRIVAALAQATVVVQAPARSGAASTAKHCRALGRTLLVVPAAPWDPRGAGNLRLMAKARVCRGAGDVLAALGRAPGRRPPPRSPPPLAGELGRVAELLSAAPRHVDELCLQAGLDAATVQRLLLELALLGRADERHGRWMARHRG